MLACLPRKILKGGGLRDTKVRTWLVALLAAILPCIAGAAGLGRLTVMTSIGQPLVAEIDLSVTREELGSLSARLALPDAYQRANLQYNTALTGARLTIETRSAGQPFLKLETTRPVTEPFIDVLVELTWSSGRLSREYTALLDPPGIPPARPAAPVISRLPELTPSPAPAASPAPAPRPSIAAEPQPQPQLEPPLAAAPPAPAPAATAAPAIAAPVVSTAAPASAPLAGGKEYGPIERGETLGKIARSTMPDGVTLEQMLVALYRTNPDAFIRQNLNLVRTGKILRVPDRDEVTAIAQSEAVTEFRTHVADWNAYRQKVADAAGLVPVEGRTAVSGKIATKVEERAAGASPKDVVKVSQGEPPGATAGKGKPRSSAERVRILEEDLMSREKALAEANERITQLEKTVKDMQKLVELKGGPGTVATAPKPVPANPEATAAAKPEPPKLAPAKPEPAKPEVAKPAALAEKPLAVAPEVKQPGPVAAAPAPAPAAAPAPAPKPAAKAALKPEPGLVDQIMSAADPVYLGAGGGVLVLGGLAFWMARRRRYRTEGERPPIAPTLSQAAVAAAGAAATTEDTAAAAPANAAATPEDDVDPLAEADVYIQYGRDTQAEEILREALGRDPRRADVQAKLLEIYASRKDKDSFGKLAAEHHKVTGGTGDGWLKVAALGYSLDPKNPLYEAGKDTTAAPIVVPPTGTSTDVDLDLGGGVGTSTDITLESGGAPAAGTDTAILDLGAAETAQKEGEQAETPLPDFTLEVPGAGAASTPDIALEPPSATASAAESNVIDFQIELPKIETGPATVAKPAAASAADPGLDFKLEIPDLDLGDKGHDKTQVMSAPAGEKDGHWYDVQTKFDLAKAYQEMGDKDGAKEILQEVIKEGDTDQKSQAKTLLDSLA
jgi:pilus assembly protein FimV